MTRTPDPPPTEPCQQKLGSFEIHERLGEGVSAVVFRAWEPAAGRWVALKALTTLAGRSEEGRARFHREGQVLIGLDHPGIVKALDVGRAEGILYIALEHVRGLDLESNVRQAGPPAWATAVEWTIQAAEAAHHAHEQGVVHRDLKPSNLLLDEGGRVRVLDFGLASLLEPSEDDLTGTAATLGTPLYMPPEQIADARSADVRSDVYSLGATLFFLLTGETPYPPEKSLVRLLDRIERGDRASLSERRSGCPPSLDPILDRAMETDREKRFPSAAELAGELAAALAGGG